ncbi:MAG: hypothetical protein WAV46_01485 [Candidatus Moraniibacteriota bacterium]
MESREHIKLETLKKELEKKDTPEKSTSPKPTEIAFLALNDGTLVEMLYDAEKSETSFAVCSSGEVKIEKMFEHNGITYIPHSPNKNLLRNRVVLFPSAVGEYVSREDLAKQIKAFMRKYLAVSPFFEDVASYYAMFTWIHDDFNELPYLRALGDYGTGKSRFLQVIGSVCYRPIFTAGATTISPIFRILEDFRGTLTLDEADFEMSTTTADIVKILNMGFMKDVPVLRSEANNKKSYDAKSFNVFGPKLIATRELYKDPALESRMITEDMSLITKREDIATNISDDFKREALLLRNKLLMFRFKEKGKHKLRPELSNPDIEPRLNQISLPLMSIIYDPKVLEELKRHFKEYNEKIKNDRTLSYRYQILEAICELMDEGWTRITIKRITDKFNEGQRIADQKSPKTMAFLIKRIMDLKTEKTRDGYALTEDGYEKIEILRKRYKITKKDDDVNVVNNENIPEQESVPF